MANTECKNCKLYKGDCGHHFIDDNGHINYGICDISVTDCCGNCNYYQEARTNVELAIDEVKNTTIPYKDLILRALVELKDYRERIEDDWK